jgi:predicted RNA-binding Zn ribbon-like protein
MDEATKRYELGERIEPGGRSPAPHPLRLVQQFVNTWNHEFPSEWDRLGTTESAAAWLADHGVLSSRQAITERDRQKLIRVREALRSLLLTKPGVPVEPEALRNLNELTVPLEVLFDAKGDSYLRPAEGGAQGIIGRLLAAAHEANVQGNWGRLKGCRQCGWAFYDRSKNRSGSWCSMSICGNRSKNRTYRRLNTRPHEAR